MRKNKRIYVALLMAFISCLFVGCKGDPIEKDEEILVPPAQSVTLSAENKSVYEGGGGRRLVAIYRLRGW